MDKENRRKIAVILSNMEGEYVSKVMNGIQSEAHACGFDIYAFNTSVSIGEESEHNIGEYNIYNLVDYSSFDGIILFPNLIQGSLVYHSVIEHIRASGVYAVSVDMDVEGFAFVGGENYKPMKQLVNHLIEQHHYTKINFVGGQDFNTDNQERQAAYCDALKEHGIPVEKERIFQGAFTGIYGRMAAKKMLESPHLMPEAVVCATDSLAIGVRTVFSERGIRIPEQVALVGFDNIFEARNSIPRLTTVNRDAEEMGREAVRCIVRETEVSAQSGKMRFPGQPVFRESCGCCSTDEEDIGVLRHKFLKLSELYEKGSVSTNIMIEDLNASRNYEDFRRRIKKHVARNAYEAFYLCLDKNLVEDLKAADDEREPSRLHDNYFTEGYPGRMSVVTACENHEVIELEDFATKQMLPKLPAEGEEPKTYVFLAIHFRERSMGYVVIKSGDFREIGSFFRTRVMNLSNSLESLRNQRYLQSMVDRIDRMYVTDSLTGLYNRFGFNRYAKESFDRSIEQGTSCMILFVDVDGLKKVNDHYGHDNGDVVISLVAYTIQNACKGEEICARVGGDEFVVYGEGYTEEDAEAYCKRLEALLAKSNRELKKPYPISASYGFTVVIPKEGDSLNRYIDAADDKMYGAKKKKERVIPQ